MRVILFTGKDWAGTTRVAAATAVRAAKAGDRTLVMSTDPAHSLADSFETRIGSAPTRIIENLWGQEIDAQERLEDNWRDIQDYMVQLMNWADRDDPSRRADRDPGSRRDLRVDRCEDPRRERQ